MIIRKAMVLAAGLGTRLRPLTDVTPKPLLPVRGKPMLDHILHALAAAGVREVLINVHHLPQQICDHVGTGEQFGVRAQFSREATILGTGGGIKAGAAFFGDDAFLLINGDIFADIDLAALSQRHAQFANAAATLVTRVLQPGETHTPLDIAPDGTMRALGRGTHHYAGAMIGTPQLIAQLPSGVSCVIRDGLVPLLQHGATIGTYLHAGMWNDIGTHAAYDAVR